jgi:Predicted transcriptional regulator
MEEFPSVPFEGVRIKLPSGKDANLVDILSFCYGLSETDITVLLSLIKGAPRGTEEIEGELKLSKASINRSLNKLLEMNLVMRVKETGNKAGRPRYLYRARNYDELREKITTDIKDCSNKMEGLIQTVLRGSTQ